MNFNDYQEATAATALYPGAGTGDQMALAYTALGLAGEAGEIANKIKKIIRDDNGFVSVEKAKDISKELGDVMWYLSRLAEELESDLDSIAQANIDKLLDRKNRGVIGGSGDNR